MTSIKSTRNDDSSVASTHEIRNDGAGDSCRLGGYSCMLTDVKFKKFAFPKKS